MRRRAAHWMTDGLDELRVLGALATAAFVSGGVASSMALTLAWLVQHHLRRGVLS